MLEKFKLKILFLIFRDIKNPSSVGGDQYLWELAKGLHTLKNEVTILCSNFRGSKDFEEINGLSVIRLRGSITLPLKVLRYYFKYMRKEDGVVIEEIIGGQRLPYLGCLYIKKPLFAIWHQKHEKIFHEQYPYPIALLLDAVERLLAIIYRKKTIITASKGSKQKLLTLGFSNNNVKVINDGVGKQFHNPKTDRKRKNIVVCLGKLRRYKRFDQAITIFKLAQKNLTEKHKLIIAGKISEIDSSYLNFLNQFAKDLCVNEFVEIVTNISEYEKVKLLERSKVLLQPSPIEGFSIVVAEANRCGTPVIGSDGVPGDVLVDKHNGFVYPFGAVNAGAKALATLLNDDLIWKKLSENSINWSRQFTWKKSSKLLHEYLLESFSPDKIKQ